MAANKVSTEPKHILVVEDEQHLARGIQFNLEAEGYRVTTAHDGSTAVKRVQRGDVDLMVLDLMLPGMSGYAVCEALRALGHDLPVLILSARTLSEDRTRGFELGADQYLTKPFDLDELISRVRGLIAMCERRSRVLARSSGREPFRFGNATIDFDSYDVTVADQPIRLTQLEMKLLSYFVEHEGRVIPRAELLENVWNMPGHISTRAPDQFIRRLRKTFEPDPAKPRYFLTFRDAGYRFAADGSG